MSEVILSALPITPERFSPFGDVIHAAPDKKAAMNEARFERFNGLAEVGVRDRLPVLSIARCKVPSSLPYRFDLVERHPFGSQAFMPLTHFRFFVVVAPAGESVDAEDLRAFVTNGSQGVNYRAGVWHMPMIALERGQEFLVVDGGADGDNCEEHYFSEPVTLLAG